MENRRLDFGKIEDWALEKQRIGLHNKQDWNPEGWIPGKTHNTQRDIRKNFSEIIKCLRKTRWEIKRKVQDQTKWRIFISASYILGVTKTSDDNGTFLLQDER